ncbi:DNA mismatch repair protein MSH5-like isoform X5 [Typha latifolia]|uniref:DNA mismatch repair protein MSH5-like isoform X5 n=1 Tax=Typha latifolia TaxID=4733 RepID=UPI003C301863
MATATAKANVALVVFLSHIGSFVPADSATVGMTDRIFCAMGSKPMTTEQSTFMIDLHQVGMMLRQATSRSLCLLDEFGKGTLTEDGIGLLGGTINHFAIHGHIFLLQVLLCTHLTEILTDNFLPQSEQIKLYTMSVLRPDSSSTSSDDIIFLYRLVPGHALLSYGSENPHPEDCIVRGLLEYLMRWLKELHFFRRFSSQRSLSAACFLRIYWPKTSTTRMWCLRC